jgi:tRNA A-37 threonylcarbamoyl transferase component Bud32
MGRGEICVIGGSRGKIAIRRYRHGGLLRHLTGDLFLFGDRPFQEVAVTEEVRLAGVPSLEILAAIRERGWGRWYKGYLITEYLPAARDLIHYLDKEQGRTRRQEVIEKAAEAVRKMHQAGIYHADLHLKNFLVDEKNREVKVYLIDFDKSAIRPCLTPSRRMKNLKRLDRSAEKLNMAGLAVTRRDKGVFCRAYATADREIRPYLRTYMKQYRSYKFLYRVGWWIARILYPHHRPWRKSITEAEARASTPHQK